MSTGNGRKVVCVVRRKRVIKARWDALDVSLDFHRKSKFSVRRISANDLREE
ncbi:MAG: hypothetical protein QOH41_3930 [Blastocatellia bacterium]|jgi:hypothetical protein|nr:hypothetical protein [Blastocatellia bacterium]